MADNGARRQLWTALICAAIVAAGIAVYSNSFRAPFIFDDFTFLEEPSSKTLWPIWPTLVERRPVVRFTWALCYSIGGPGELGYHVFNVAVHLLAALALFGIVRRTLLHCRLPIADPSFVALRATSEGEEGCRMMTEKDESTAKSSGREHLSVRSAVIPQQSAIGNRQSAIALVLAFCAALLWMLHPLQTQAVTYIVQRLESLMGLFYLLTLYCFIRATSSPRPAGWHVATVTSCLLGMGCKEVMVSAPLIVLLYDRTFITGSFRETLRRRWGLYLGLAATWAGLGPSLGAAVTAHPDWGGFNLQKLTPLEYARSELGVILHYLRLAFLPTGLCLDYDWPIATGIRAIVPGAIVVGGLLAATVWALVRRPMWGFAGAWFFLVLAPTSSIMPINDLAFEQRMYLPLAAVVTACVVAAYVLGNAAVRRVAQSAEMRGFLGRGLGTIAILSVAGALGCLTFLRNEDYRTAISIWEDTADKRPENPRAWSNLGDAYVSASRYEEAIRSCDKAIKLAPYYSDAYNNRGLAYSGIGRQADALRDYDRALAINPDFALARVSRANAYESAGRSDLALRDYCRAIELNPNNPEAYNNRGVAYARAGRSDEALRDWGEALKLNSDYTEAYNNRGNVYAQLGRLADAIRDYDRAIALKADFAEAYYDRAIANRRLGRLDEAVRDYTRILALNPENAAALNGRGKALADANRSAEAIRDFDQAIALNPGYAEAYYNRGNARADADRRSEAVRDYNQAIALKPDFAAAYNNRAVAHYEMKAYDKAWADVNMFVRLGGKPDPGFLKALGQAAGPAERAQP